MDKLKVKAFQSSSPPGTLPPFSKGDVHTERKNQHRAAGQLNNHRNKWPFKPDASGDMLLKDPPVPGGGGALLPFTHLMTGTKCRPTQFCVKFYFPFLNPALQLPLSHCAVCSRPEAPASFP